MTIIIDYGIGNVFSVQRSLEKCGETNIKLSSEAEDIINADRIIMPGVGAFKDGMQGLFDRNLIEPLNIAIKKGTPFMGICLGMQMLATYSKEFGNHDGLNLIPGKVVPIVKDSDLLKLPYIGWTKLDFNNNGTNELSILSGLNKNDYIYLVHSYHVKTDLIDHTLASYYYGDIKVTAAIGKDNVIGLQFHPEKSGEVGLGVIKKFLSL